MTPRKNKQPGPAAPYHHGDLRNALIVAGLAALEEIGARELSLRFVARSVGVSEAAPSRHFDGKEGLLAAMAAQGFSELASQRRSVQSSGEPVSHKVRAMMDQYVLFAQQHKGLFDLMVGPRILQRDAHMELTQASTESFELFAQAVCELAREHGWTLAQLNLIVHAAWAVEHGLASLILGGRAPRADRFVEVDEMIEFTISLFLSGVTAGPAHLERGAGRGGKPRSARSRAAPR
jgi:AcrR family transcriptional regulator